MAVLPFRTSMYALNIYRTGMGSLTSIPTEYYIPVEQYAATKFTIPPYATPENRTQQLDEALNNGWITQTQYDETVAYIV
jgi:hypothetical protein